MTHDEHWASVEETFKIYPDFHAELLGLVAEGDRVFQYWKYSGHISVRCRSMFHRRESGLNGEPFRTTGSPRV